MSFPNPETTTRGLRRLFPTVRFGPDLQVLRNGTTVTGVIAPRAVTPEEILAAATRAPSTPPPAAVGKGQLYAALVAEGWFSSTETADATVAAILAALPETQAGQPFREVMRALFLKAAHVDLTNQLVEIIRTHLNKTTDERDALFRRAATF